MIANEIIDFQIQCEDQQALPFFNMTTNAHRFVYFCRCFSPELGGQVVVYFEDPIGFAAGDANISRYVANNPLSFTDPDGLAIVPVDQDAEQGGENDETTVLVPLGSEGPNTDRSIGPVAHPDVYQSDNPNVDWNKLQALFMSSYFRMGQLLPPSKGLDYEGANIHVSGFGKIYVEDNRILSNSAKLFLIPTVEVEKLDEHF